MVKLFSLKSPDGWATTKQACRDTYVVTCFLPSTICIYIYIYIYLILESIPIQRGSVSHNVILNI